MKIVNHRDSLFLLIILAVFVCLFSYIFNPKIDLNGDNCDYYMLATSLATGHGYSNISDPAYPAINSFPPGYPLLMAPLRVITDSFIAQKIMNGFFLLISIVFLYFYMKRANKPDSLAFVVSVFMLMNVRLLHFATMMMSEMSFLMTSVLVLFFIAKMEEEKPFYKDKWFYMMLIALVFNYHIRTQGITLLAAVTIFFMIKKQWKQSLATVLGFIIGLLPYLIRNKIQGLGQSRYLDTIALANPWRPEEGTLSLEQVVERFFDTLGMLVSKALPNSVFPFVDVDYAPDNTAGIGLWFLGIALIVVIVYGFWQFKTSRWLLLFYTVFTFGLISIFSTPSGNRYLTGILPILTMGEIVGIYSLFVKLLQKISLPMRWAPYPLLLIGGLAITPIKLLHAENSMQFPNNYINFFQIGTIVRQQLPSTVKVASRKPSLFYMYSRTLVCGFPYKEDTKEFLKEMIKSDADFVVLDQLGYSATYLYLYPAIQRYPDVFEPVGCIKDPDTYLIRINKNEAQKHL